MILEKLKQNNLSQRAITSIIFVPVMLILTWLGGMSYIIFTLLISSLCIRELCLMVKKDKKHWKYWFYGTFLCIVFLFLNLVSIRGQGLRESMFLLFVVWTTDTSAYFFGISIGGRKIAPQISFGKTWSGFVGALICSGLFGLISHFIGLTKFSNNIIETMLDTIFISFCSQSGDLAESALKRYFEVKDSGDTLPGHGGLLDRFDGMIFASFAMAGLIAN